MKKQHKHRAEFIKDIHRALNHTNNRHLKKCVRSSRQSTLTGTIPLAYYERRRMEWDRERSRLIDEIKDLGCCNADIKARLDQLKVEMSRLPFSPDYVTSKLDELSLSLKEERKRFVREKSLRADAEARLEILEKEKTELITLQAKEKELREGLEAEIIALRDQVTELSAQRRFLGSERESAEKEAEEYRREVDNQLSEKSRLEEQMEAIKGEYEHKIEELKTELEEERWGRRQAEADRMDMSARLADLHEKRDVLGLKLQNMEKEAEKISEEMRNEAVELQRGLKMKEEDLERMSELLEKEARKRMELQQDALASEEKAGGKKAEKSGKTDDKNAS